jgi:heme oxygenase (biliverdin-producing, ferredoxin)
VAVYGAIEDLADQVEATPFAAPFVRREVFRRDPVEGDLAHYWGPSWIDRVELLPETAFYVDRIRSVGSEDPIAWIAHAYTRYLADLSGGLEIDRAITRAYGLDRDGRRLYEFDLPGGVDPRTWKNAYRQLLNILDVDVESKVRLVEEALVAYECNIALNDALVARHRDSLLTPSSV